MRGPRRPTTAIGAWLAALAAVAPLAATGQDASAPLPSTVAATPASTAPERPAAAPSARPAAVPVARPTSPRPAPSKRPANASTNDVPDVFPLRPLDLLPPPSPIGLRPLTFPVSWPVAVVEGLAHDGTRLWISARPWSLTNSTPQLWSFQPLNNRLEPVRGKVDQHPVRSLALATDGLWLGFDAGVAVLNTRTFTVDAHGAPQGITSGNIAGLAAAQRGWFALSEAGALFRLKPDGRSWSRLPGLPSPNPRVTERFLGLQGSGDWLATWTENTLAVRHHSAPEWSAIPESQWKGLPALDPPRWRCVAPDGDGGFWLGSNLGLHFLVAETGSMEHRTAPVRPTVPGGIGFVVQPGFQPAKAAFDAARTRQAEGIRERMRERSRLARLASDLRTRLDPFTPATRLPAPVRALARDGALTWVATEDPTGPLHSRILLWHGPSRRWIAHFTVALPVRCMTADAQFLWIGNDLSRIPGGAPILVVDKRPLLALPAPRWLPDEIRPDELGTRLANLPLNERAVLAFFAGDAQRVVELLDPAPPSAEGLFLLAFAHDTIGLNQPDRRDALIDRLVAEFPTSPHAEAVRSLRPPSNSPRATNAPPAESPLARLFKRRDLDGNGRIDAAEFKEWRGPDAPFKDPNNDGGLDMDEFDAVLREAP